MREPKKFNPVPFAYHEELTLEITGLTNLGIGVSRMDGWVIMVPFGLPGERVRVQVFWNHKNYSEADLVEVLEASPDRVEPKCDLFGQCGGCQYQNLSYEAQLKWKSQHVQELLLKIGGVEVEVKRAHPSPKEYYYRLKITPHYPKPREGEALPIGFLHQGMRNRIVDVPYCLIATEGINKVLECERLKIRERAQIKGFRKGGTLLMRETLEGVTQDHNAVVSEKVGDYIFKFHAGEFFQNNSFILNDFVQYILKEAKTEGVENLVDTYCGIGLFAISGSTLFENCLGIEVSQPAVEQAKENAAINSAENCNFLLGKAEAIFEQVTFDSGTTSVIIDPPRKGCDPEFLKQLSNYKPKRIVYVSCDPATQARDVKYLLTAGYEITEVQPFDLFPQTRHIENVVTLTQLSSS